MSEIETVTPEQAIALLPDGDTVHTFMESPMCLIGADWQRESIIDALNTAKWINLTQGMAKSMGHGMVCEYEGEPLFIETRQEVAA